MTIDSNELRRKVNSPDIVDHIDLHANIKPFLSELLDRLEAAEKERDAAKDLADRLALALNTSNHERDNLRAKLEAMEQQEPVMWANSSTINSSRINKERGGCGDQHTCSETQTTYHDTPLYALPGAQTQG